MRIPRSAIPLVCKSASPRTDHMRRDEAPRLQTLHNPHNIASAAPLVYTSVSTSSR